MTELSVAENQFDFRPLHDAMQRYVDQDLFAGMSSAVLLGRDLVDVHCSGLADREAGTPLRTDHIFRVFSNTKLVTSIAALLLYEEGRFGLDDPVDKFIPQLGDRKVLRPAATSATDTEPAKDPITIRHLMTHTSGLSYGLVDPGSLMFQLYNEAGAVTPNTSLADMMDRLAGLPLSFHPGTGWEYSVGTDVLGRVVEVISGLTLDQFFQTRMFDPLGMVDTAFHCPAEKQDRLAAYYAGADLVDMLQGGLTRADEIAGPKDFSHLYPNADGAEVEVSLTDMVALVRNLLPGDKEIAQPIPRLSGGGGLLSTLPDMVALIRSLLPGDGMLLRPETMEMLRTNQLPEGRFIQFPNVGVLPGRGYGLAGGVILAPFPDESEKVVGDYFWGGIAGTQWWVSPNNNLAGVVMTQRALGFSHPFAAELKAHIYDAVLK